MLFQHQARIRIMFHSSNSRMIIHVNHNGSNAKRKHGDQSNQIKTIEPTKLFYLQRVHEIFINGNPKLWTEYKHIIINVLSNRHYIHIYTHIVDTYIMTTK